MMADHGTATLRAANAGGLADPGVRDVVVAAARGIAERTGVELVNVRADENAVEVTVMGTGIVALGLVAELRRTTEAWHRGFAGTSLWTGES